MCVTGINVQGNNEQSCEKSNGSFLHSYYFGEDPTARPLSEINGHSPSSGNPVLNGNYTLQKTRSSDAVNAKPKPPRPNKLSKTKSSTYISPDQSERIMYNSKVTLTLRRSRLSLNSDDEVTAVSGQPEDPELRVVPTERTLRRTEELRSLCPTPPPLPVKPSLHKTVRV